MLPGPKNTIEVYSRRCVNVCVVLFENVEQLVFFSHLSSHMKHYKMRLQAATYRKIYKMLSSTKEATKTTKDPHMRPHIANYVTTTHVDELSNQTEEDDLTMYKRQKSRD